MAVRWAPVAGYEGIYEVSDQGEILSIGTRISSRILKGGKTRGGYRTVTLWRDGAPKGFRVARLVAIAFVPNPDELPVVDHANGDVTDDRAENLRWASYSLNGRNRHTCFGVTGEVGVFLSSSQTNPYRACVQIDGQFQHLGVFPTVEAASAARREALKGDEHGTR